MRMQFHYGLVVCVWLAIATPAWSGNFIAHLDQAATVPAAAVTTNAQGQTIIKDRNGELTYKVLVAGLQNVVAAHIHCAPVGVAGPVGVTLFASAPIVVNGILAEGAVVPNAGNACGWQDGLDVIDAIDAGNAYINVHTIQNLAGEIRGQLE